MGNISLKTGIMQAEGAAFALSFLLLFLSAGTLRYFKGWLFLILLFLPMTGWILFFHRNAPDRLALRLLGREEGKGQRRIPMVFSLTLPFVLILAGADFRFGFSREPGALVFCASLVFLLSFCFYAHVMLENEWLFRTVTVFPGQKVKDTGPYAVIRHPLYLSLLCLILSAPLILGSFCAFFLAAAVYPLGFAVRISQEERMLLRSLPGYRDYCERVRFRLIPGIF